MDKVPFNELCSYSSISPKELNDNLHDHGNDSAQAIVTIHSMTSLHMLSLNLDTPVEGIIAALLDVNMEVFFLLHQR